MENEKAIKLAEDCRILLNGILGCAELGYLGDGLRFSDAAIDTLIKAIFPGEYKETIARLKAERAKVLEKMSNQKTVLTGVDPDGRAVSIEV